MADQFPMRSGNPQSGEALFCWNNQPCSRLKDEPVIHSTSMGILIDVRVIPRSGRSGVAGVRDGTLLVRLNAPPVEGAANAELVEVIADALSVPKRSVAIVAGERARQKRVRVEGVSVADATAALTPGDP